MKTYWKDDTFVIEITREELDSVLYANKELLVPTVEGQGFVLCEAIIAGSNHIHSGDYHA